MEYEAQVIEPLTDEEFNQHHETRFKELSADIILKATEILKSEINNEDKEFLIDLYKNEPDNTKAKWYIGEHFWGGMYVRNLLHQNGLLDDQLPSGNWDDYYTQCLECAIGVRELPTKS